MSLTRVRRWRPPPPRLQATVAKPAIAAKEPIMIGYLPALTGPSSSTGIGINRGIQLAVQEINAAGGIDGRHIELIVRDTQSDPTKGRERSGGAHAWREGERRLWPGQFRRVARGGAVGLARTSTPQLIRAGSIA